jgi:hypothetical protein
MQEKFDRERPLRHALKVKNILTVPLMDRHESERRFEEQHAPNSPTALARRRNGLY